MTTSSKTDICNLSLDLLNAGTVLDVDTPTTATEELMARWYDVSRKAALREHPWNFASKRTTLAASSTAPAFGYTHAFPVPSDYVRLLSIHDAEGFIIPTKEYDVMGNEILYDAQDGVLRIKYVYDFTNIPSMDYLFIEYLSYKLALNTGFKVDGSNTTIERVEALRKTLGRLSKSIDGQEKPPTRVQSSVNHQSRRAGSTRRSDRVVFNG